MVKHLGYHFTPSGLTPASVVWPVLLGKVERLVCNLSKRSFSIPTRMMLFRSLVLPRLTYTSMMIPPRPEDVKAVDKLQWKCLWNGRNHGLVNRATCLRPTTSGGLGAINIHLYFRCQLLDWVKRLYAYPMDPWQQALELRLMTALRVNGKSHRGDPFTQQLIQSQLKLPKPWISIIKAWKILGGGLINPPPSRNGLLTWSITRNPHLRLDTRNLRSLQHIGNVWRLGDIWDPKDKSWKPPKRKCKRIQELALHKQTALIADYVDNQFPDIPENDESPPTAHLKALGIRPSAQADVVDLANLRYERFYKQVVMATQEQDEDALQLAVMINHTTNCSSPMAFWRDLRTPWRDRKSSDLHWLLLHNGVRTGPILLHYNLNVDASMCKACNLEESMRHLFWDCHLAKDNWHFLLRLAKQLWPTAEIYAPPMRWTIIKTGLCLKNIGGRHAKGVWSALFGVMLRVIWRTRNAAHFDGEHKSMKGIRMRFTTAITDWVKIQHRITRKSKQELAVFEQAWCVNGVLAGITSEDRLVIRPATKLVKF